MIAPVFNIPLVLPSSLEVRRGDRWGGDDGTKFCEFTPQYVVRGWSEMVLTYGAVHITKEKGVNLSN